MRNRERQAVWATAVMVSALFLVGCGKGGGVDRLTGGGSSTPSNDVPAGPPADPHTGNPADPGTPGDPGHLPAPSEGTAPTEPSTPAASSPTAPSPAPSPTPTAPRTETYRFEGYVIAGGTLPAGVGVGDKVTGTFTINLDKSMEAEFPNRGIYLAMETIQGTVGPKNFSGGEDYIYVGDHQSLGCALDTAHMNLETAPINYDFFFFIADGQPYFSDHKLDQLHNFDQHIYRRVDLWFETDPMNGGGFNADIYAFHRIDGPAMAALSASDYVNVRW